MNRLELKDFAKLVNTEGKRLLLVKDIIHRLAFHMYIPYYKENDLDKLIRFKYEEYKDKFVDYEKIVALHGPLTSQSYGSCMIISGYTLDELVDVVKRTLEMKAFL